MITVIESSEQKQKKYIVTISYVAGDSHDDKNLMPKGDDKPRQMIYRCYVWATSMVDAIRQGVEAVNIEKAEVMSDFVTSHPLYGDKDSFTRDEIEDMYKQAIEMGIFQTWMMIQPTAIQCNLVDDEETLKDMTVESVMHHASHIGDEAEDFLKEEGNDT